MSFKSTNQYKFNLNTMNGIMWSVYIERGNLKEEDYCLFLYFFIE